MFFKLLQQANADEQNIAMANENISKLELELNRYNFNHFKKLRAICTSAQQKRFDEIIQIALMRMSNPKPPPPLGKDENRPPPEDDRPEGNRPPPNKN